MKNPTPLLVAVTLAVPLCSGGSREGNTAIQQAATCRADSLAAPAQLVKLSAVRARLNRQTFPDSVGAHTTISRGGRRLVVASLSWGGPSDGALVVMDCDGQFLHLAEVGYVFRLEEQDASGDGNNQLVVDHQTGQGTGWIQRQVTVYDVVRDTLSVLWSGITIEDSYQSAEVGSYHVHASVSFPARGRIVREGQRTTVKYNPATRSWEPSGKATPFRELFKFDPKTGVFVKTS
jgi:hypothetical protein